MLSAAGMSNEGGPLSSHSNAKASAMIDGGPQSLALAESRSRTVSSLRGFGIQTFEALGGFALQFGKKYETFDISCFMDCIYFSGVTVQDINLLPDSQGTHML